MKKLNLLMSFLTLSLLGLTGCSKEEGFVNPGDYLGGGGSGEVASNASDVTSDIKDEISASWFDNLSDVTSDDNAINVTPTSDVYEITQTGDEFAYRFSGSYGGILLNNTTASLVHLIFDNVTITNDSDIAITESDCDIDAIVITLIGDNSITSTASGKNAIHLKSKLAFNGTGLLSVTSNGKNAIKCSKEVAVTNCKLELTAANHAISVLSFIATDCNIKVLDAGKDGINAECNDKTTTFTTESGYVYLKNVNYTCNTSGDGIQADTVIYINGGTYNIKTNGVFVTKDMMAEYDLTTDDFRYIKNGNEYQKVASDYFGRNTTMYALAQGCKGIKVGEIEYPDPNDDSKEIAVTNGDYSIIIDGGTFTIDSTDDVIHANSGNLSINGGTFTITTLDDALTSDKLTKITSGTINILKSYEGIEGGYVEISGGNINLVSQDDGINAASDDNSVTEHIIISGGKVCVDASGDGIDSNGTSLIFGGEVYVAGPTANMDCSIDSDKGTVVNGGYLFAVGSLGMVETPASNSSQYVVSFALNKTIAAGTNISLTDKDGNAIFSFKTPKQCQSVIISCPELTLGNKYQIYGGDSSLCEFTISQIITTVGSSGGIGNPGGGPGGPGGFGPGGR